MTRSVMSVLVWAGCLTLGLGMATADEAPFQGDAKGRALYDRMIKTLRDAKTLSFEGESRFEAKGKQLSHATYRVMLKKPNQFRVEASRSGSGKTSGILVGDGKNLWIYWPNGKPRYSWENSGKYAEQYEKYKNVFYMTKRTRQGRHSILHEVCFLGAGLMPIVDWSTFHGYEDCMQVYLDGARYLGPEVVDGEPCEQIEASMMKHQRSWYLWLSTRDHLPRKLKQVIRVSHDITAHEVWSNVEIDKEIPDDQFIWSPPEGWKRWKKPPTDEGLLPPGTEAPDFELTSIEDEKIRLSDFRGNFVWLYKWRVG